MTRITFAAHPLLLGFDHIERLAERAARAGDGYPPYNIEHLPPDGFRVTLAVAGFSPDQLDVTLEDRNLVIRGTPGGGDEGRSFLHRGIAGRAFQRSFVLEAGIEVGPARLENGLLVIDLSRTPRTQIVRSIPITRS